MVAEKEIGKENTTGETVSGLKVWYLEKGTATGREHWLSDFVCENEVGLSGGVFLFLSLRIGTKVGDGDPLAVSQRERERTVLQLATRHKLQN